MMYPSKQTYANNKIDVYICFSVHPIANNSFFRTWEKNHKRP